MGGMQNTRSIGAIFSIAAVLGCLSLAQPVDAREIQVASVRDSFVPIVVIDASPQESARRAEQADDQSVAGANDAAAGFDIAVDRPAELLAPLTDVPLAAWLLLGTCVLCAGFGPRALRRFEDDAQESAPTEPRQARKPPRTSLT